MRREVTHLARGETENLAGARSAGPSWLDGRERSREASRKPPTQARRRRGGGPAGSALVGRDGFGDRRNANGAGDVGREVFELGGRRRRESYAVGGKWQGKTTRRKRKGPVTPGWKLGSIYRPLPLEAEETRGEEDEAVDRWVRAGGRRFRRRAAHQKADLLASSPSISVRPRRSAKPRCAGAWQDTATSSPTDRNHSKLERICVGSAIRSRTNG
jgi:hypothetical protein